MPQLCMLYGFGVVPGEYWRRSGLEVGCLRGEKALELTQFSRWYFEINISSAGVDYRAKMGMSSVFECYAEDADALDAVTGASVDYAFGHGALHHFDLARFSPALALKLALNEFARLVEPAQRKFGLQAFRQLTPQLRTPDEHPFEPN